MNGRIHDISNVNFQFILFLILIQSTENIFLLIVGWFVAFCLLSSKSMSAEEKLGVPLSPTMKKSGISL